MPHLQPTFIERKCTQGPSQTCPLNLAWYSTACRLKQLQTPSKKAQGAPPLNLGICGRPCETCLLIWLRIPSWDWNFLLGFPLLSMMSPTKQQPQTSGVVGRVPQGLMESVRSSILSQASLHLLSSGVSWQNCFHSLTRKGSTKLRSIRNSQVLSCRQSKVITPFPTKIPLKLMFPPALLCLSIRTARSGMYFPAQDYPAIQKGLLLYSGNLSKKSSRENMLSEAVWVSLYLKFLSRLQEYPTPAGDSKKRRLEAVCQEYLFSVRVSPTLQLAPSASWQGPISWRQPSMEEQPGPPLSQRVTGSLLFLPLTDSRKTQWVALMELLSLRQPEQPAVLQEAGNP